MKQSVDGLVPNERRLLIGGLELILEGQDRFWSREIMDVMDRFRTDGYRTGGGTFLRAVGNLLNRELVSSDRLKVLPSKQRIYYSLTEEGRDLACLFHIKQVVDDAQDFREIASELHQNKIGEFVISRLLESR